MDLARALRLIPTVNPPHEGTVAFAGAGGKTTAIFQLARQLVAAGRPVVVTASAHLGAWQTLLADRHVIVRTSGDLPPLPQPGITLVTGPFEGDRTLPLDPGALEKLHNACSRHHLPLLIEADGSRQLPIKAPGPHEPPIPAFSEMVVITAGLTGVGRPLAPESVHRPEAFAEIAGIQPGEAVTPETLARVLMHPQGGLKNIPLGARRAVLLNQAETPALLSTGGRLARTLRQSFDSVLVGSLNEGSFQTFEKTAGIILAGGGSTRLGQPKQLLDWHGEPFVWAVARTALAAGLEPVLIVTGAHARETEQALEGLSLRVIQNAGWEEGQASSIRAGVEALTYDIWTGSAIFLLVDQPQVNTAILEALAATHAESLPPILAPLVIDQRANPVLLDRVTYPDLMELRGDSGGRGIFHKHKVEYLPWHDGRLLLDVDTPEQYTRLVEDDTL